MKPRILNKKIDPIPPDAVYVGRPTKWGNPFSHLTHSRARFIVAPEEVISRYEDWLIKHPELIAAAQQELAGKDLVCWCAPGACHAEVLYWYANGEHPDAAWRRKRT